MSKKKTVVDAQLALKLYETMVRIRTFEERAIELSEDGTFDGKLHSYLGEEAIAAGACLAIEAGDYVLGHHRPVGHALALGCDSGRLMAEFMGKATGLAGGKGGMMHMADYEHGLLGTTGIVGGGIPIAAGAALALKMQGLAKVVLCFFGDGAANTGSFHEGLNLAAIWKVPAVFICENNQWGVSVHVSESTSVEKISARAAAYSIPGEMVDGNDPLAVYDAVRGAAKSARSGGGPVLIEAVTYRLRGHFEGDPLNYRSDEQYAEALAREPVGRFRERLLREGVADEDALGAIEKRAEQEVAKAEEYARSSPEAPLATVTSNVFA